MEKRKKPTENFSKNEHVSLMVLKSLANNQCFQFVNRGELWFKRLKSNEQKQLEEQYQKWCTIILSAKKGIKIKRSDLPEKLSWLD